MDPFTESILAKARLRANLLTFQNGNDEEDVSETKVLSEKNAANEPKSVEQNITKHKVSDSEKNSSKKTKTLCIQKENIDMEIKVTSSDEVRVQVEFEECSDTDPESSVGLRKNVKDRLNRLGKLYAGNEDLSSPIHRTEETFMSSSVQSEDRSVSQRHGKKFMKGLANLAEEINQWEDEVKTPSKADKPALKWDKSVLDSLESQGFERKPNDSKLVYNYAKNNKNDPVNRELNKNENDEKKESNVIKKVNEKKESNIVKNVTETKVSNVIKKTTEKKENNIVNKVNEKRENADNKKGNFQRFPTKAVARTADKEKTTDSSPRRTTTPDPSCLSISERKALFEKNKGEVLVPKAPFGMPIPINKTPNSNSNKVNSNSTESPIVSLDNIKLRKVGFTERANKTNKSLEDSWKPTVKSMTKKFDGPVSVEKSSQPLKEANTEVLRPPATGSAINEVRPGQSLVKTGGIQNTVEALFKNKSTISEVQIQSQLKEQRSKEMEILMNRFKRKEIQEQTIEEGDESEAESVCETRPLVPIENRENLDETSSESEDVEDNKKIANLALNGVQTSNDISSPRRSGGKRSSVSPRVAAVLEDVKRIKVSPVKPGRIYPSLSDIEAGKETETDDGCEESSANNSSVASYSGTLETSFGREILEAVCKNQTPIKRPIYDDSTASDVSDVLGDMDEYLDELEYEEEGESMGPTPPKVTKSKDSSFASHSFNYKNCTPTNCFKSPCKPRMSPEKRLQDSVKIVDGDDVLPLTYTVSFYRKQTNNAASPSPMKTVTRNEANSAPESDKQEIFTKIKDLQAEVQKLQLTIAQTSQALNLCNNTFEFMGSTEQVEAERVLLLSTHRRQAILNEIQRLKVEETLRPQNHNEQEIPIEKGILTISNIALPLKKDYVRALAVTGGKGHHVICLVKCGEEVVSTKLVSTVATNMKNPCYELVIPGSVTLKNIYNNSTVTFEVYCLKAQDELLPHDVKYHIKKNKATPKKSKHESLLSRPVKESPGGPQAVRSPSFAQMGYIVFSVYKMNRKSWSLNNTPTMSPLEGSVEMNACCELTASVEYRGFLTMFEDISGFGAWHRRWCFLKGDALSYWKYPDDEKRMLPINSIDLKNCITKEVGPVSRDICARLHTFLIETEREPLPQDRETLTTICKKDKTIIRHLLSADTKEERIKWCAQFNTILLASKICGNS